jgi:hypothetical protein
MTEIYTKKQITDMYKNLIENKEQENDCYEDTIRFILWFSNDKQNTLNDGLKSVEKQNKMKNGFKSLKSKDIKYCREGHKLILQHIYNIKNEALKVKFTTYYNRNYNYPIYLKSLEHLRNIN